MKRTLLTSAVLLAAVACASDPNTASSPAATAATADEFTESQQALIAGGKSQFLRCKSCHVVDAEAPPPFGDSLGPHLEDIVGRPAASVEGFEYTEALQTLDLVWDEQTLDQWLLHPHAMVPGMCEPFMGMDNPEHRQALIAYLKNPTN